MGLWWWVINWKASALDCRTQLGSLNIVKVRRIYDCARMVEDNALLVCAMAWIECVESRPYIRNRVMTICRVPVIIEGKNRRVPFVLRANSLTTSRKICNDSAKLRRITASIVSWGSG